MKVVWLGFAESGWGPVQQGLQVGVGWFGVRRRGMWIVVLQGRPAPDPRKRAVSICLDLGKVENYDNG